MGLARRALATALLTGTIVGGMAAPALAAPPSAGGAHTEFIWATYVDKATCEREGMEGRGAGLWYSYVCYLDFDPSSGPHNPYKWYWVLDVEE